MIDQEEYLEMLRLEEKFTKRPSVWEVSKAFPDCRDIAVRVAYDLAPLFVEHEDKVVMEFIKADRLHKVYHDTLKYLGMTRRTLGKKELDIDKAKAVKIETLYDFGKARIYAKRIQTCCPFHKETNPSFIIYTDQNSFHCFSCNLGGSSVDFIMALHNTNFVGAVKIINGEA